MKRLLSAITTPTAKSSTFYYFSSVFSSFFRYLFHLILLRLLVPAEYGEFLSYLSLVYILGIPTIVISNVVTKYVADYRGKDDLVSINKLFYFLVNKISVLTIPFGSLLIIFSQPLAVIFKAHYIAFIVLGVSVFISVFQVIISSYIFAFQKIIFQTIIGFVSVIVTIVLSVVSIKLGYGATGVISAQILTGVLMTVISFLYIKSSVYPKIIDGKVLNFNISNFVGYSFIYALGTSLLVSTDILMVRIFFDSHTSGLYSSLSMLGRMILFGLSPLITLVFPIAAHRHAKKVKTNSTFFKLGLVIFIFGIGAASLFSLFPTLVINLFSGVAYIESASWLHYVVFSMAFFAFSQFIISFLMATDQAWVNVFLLVATILQPIIIFVFRGSISSVIIGNFVLQIGLFLVLVYILSAKIFSRDLK